MLHGIRKWHVLLFGCILVICYFIVEAISKKEVKSENPVAYKLEANITTVTPNNFLANQLNCDTVAPNNFLANQLNCKNIPLEMHRVQHGSYWIYQNYVRGSISQSIGCADSITYATNGDYTFFWSLATVVKRWLAPVSFAVYTPGYDFQYTMESIQYVRNCLPESELIKQFVTFHIYFPNNHVPTHIPFSENEALQWPYDCNSPPYGKGKNQTLYRTAKKMTYPINVGRNIARKAANTYFIFTCDMELYPSPGIVNRFLQMVTRNISLVIDAPGVKKNPRVFVLNIFELKKNASIPNNKEELKIMLRNKMAQGFHFGKCTNCHRLPHAAEWLNLTSVNEMGILAIAKRQEKHTVWEPFYISDNKEPVFDERVHWEGQSNKRIQAYAMCLLDYDYYILNDGFLVHSPGIKKFNYHDPRNKYIAPMNYFIRHTIVKQYKVLYGSNVLCKV